MGLALFLANFLRTGSLPRPACAVDFTNFVTICLKDRLGDLFFKCNLVYALKFADLSPQLGKCLTELIDQMEDSARSSAFEMLLKLSSMKSS